MTNTSIDDIAQMLAEGRRLYAARLLHEAKSAFLRVQSVAPDQEETLLGLCRIAYEDYAWDDLESWSKRLVAAFPECGEGQLFRARACNQVRDWNAAAAAWSAVVRDRPGWPEAHFQLARALARAGQAKAAGESAARLASMTPRQALHADLLYQIKIELGDCAGAKAHAVEFAGLDRAVASERLDSFVASRNHWGVTILARVLLDVADDLDPSRRQAIIATAEQSLQELSARAAGLERAGKLAEAHQDYTAVLVFDPNDQLAARSRARILRTIRAAALEALKSDDAQQAQERFEVLVRLDDSDADARLYLGRLLMKARDWTAAIPVWQELVVLKPDLVESHLQLARAFTRSGDEGRALPIWRHLLQLQPDHAEALEMVATAPGRFVANSRMALDTGDALRAVQILVDARAIYPDDPEFDKRLDHARRKLVSAARAAYKLSNFGAVLEFAPVLAQHVPNDAEGQLLIARAAMGLRDYDVAIPAWQRLAEIDPDQAPMCRLQLARSYFRSRQTDKARQALWDILNEDPSNAEAKGMLERL